MTYTFVILCIRKYWKNMRMSSIPSQKTNYVSAMVSEECETR